VYAVNQAAEQNVNSLDSLPRRMTKDEILETYRRLVRKSGGSTPGKSVLLAALRGSGVSEHTFRSGLWRSWRAFQEEAGFAPNVKTQRFPDEQVLEPYARLARKLNRVPGDDDIRFERREDPSIPSVAVIRARAPSLADRAAWLRAYVTSRPAWDDIAALVAPSTSADDDGETSDAAESATTGYVYLVKYGRHFKVGSTNSIDRRTREIQLHLPSRTELVHHIATDDPSGIEAYWHRRFDSKRHRGEWFSLSASDVKAFRNRKFM
jgi:hypothetical protein